MRSLRHVTLGVLLVAALVPGSTPASGSAAAADVPLGAALGPGVASRAPATCTAQGGTGAVAAPRRVRNIPTGETGWFSSPGLVDLDGDGRLEIVAPFYSTFVFDAAGQPARQGPGEQGPGLRAVGRRRPRGRRRAGHRGRRQRGHRGGLRVPRRPAAAQGGLAGVHQQRRPVARGPRPGRGRPRRRRPGRGRGDDDQHRAQGRAGLRLRRERAAVPARRAAPTRGPATAATARTARTSASATSTTTRSWRSSRPSTTTRSTPSTSTAPRCSPRRGSPTPSPGRAGQADGLGRLHPVGEPEGRAAPLPPAQGRVAEPGAPALAAVDRLTAVGGRPRRRRPQRGHRAAQRREAHPLPHAGLRLHGAGRGVRRRQPLGDAAPGLREAPDVQPPGPPARRRLVPAQSGIPAPTVVDLTGDGRPEIVAALPGGKVYAVGPDGRRLWTRTYAPKRAKTFASEVVAADLNKDGTPELVFGTYSLHRNAGRLVVLVAQGKKLSVTRLKHQGRDGNGIGVRRGALDRRTSPATARSRSCSPRSTTASTSTPSRAPAPAACPGRPAAGTLLRNGMGPATAP